MATLGNLSMYRRICIWLILPAVAVTLFISCKVQNQKPKEVFENGTLPPRLNQLAQGLTDLNLTESQKIKIIAEDQKGDFLSVGVIDNGVDFTHPDLLNQVDFDIQNNEIVGAGHDFMGQDNWAHPNLINPYLFAFGARDVINGKIIDPVDDPLMLIRDLNVRFMKSLVARIQSHPTLKDSLYAKINADAMTVYAAFEMAMNPTLADTIKESDDGKIRNQKYFEEKIAKAKVETNTERTLKRFLTSPWEFAAGNLGGEQVSGIPFFLTDFTSFLRLEHGLEFLSLVKEEFSKVDQEADLKGKIEKFASFLNARQEGESLATSRIKAVDKLNEALFFAEFGPGASDPHRNFARFINWNLLSYDEAQKLQSAPAGEIFSILNDLTSKAAKLNETMLSAKSYQARNAAKANLAKMAQGKRMLDWLLSKRSPELLKKTGIRDSFDLTEPQIAHLKRLKHPFLSTSSNGEIHGTHVAGIIAKQNSSAKIVPIRVSTEGSDVTDAYRQEVQQRFVNEFAGWLNHPAIFRGVRALMMELGVSQHIDWRNQAIAIREILETFEEEIEKNTREDYLSFLFTEELVQAVKFAGQRELKVVNISLGAKYQKAAADPRDKQDSVKRAKLFQQFKMEVFKNILGRTILKFAPQTIFVVAAGNSANWLDSRANLSIPADISSLQFDVRPGEPPLPNNHLDNIIAVGSLDTKDYLSGFTNLPLTAKWRVYTRGEDVLAPIKTSDTSAVQQAMARELGEMVAGFALPQSNEEAIELAKRVGAKIPEGLSVLDQARFAKDVLNRYNNGLYLLGGQTSAVFQSTLFQMYPAARARLNGTSMASPLAAGILSQFVVNKARSMRLPLQQIYNHPAFKPSIIIPEFISKNSETQQIGTDFRFARIRVNLPKSWTEDEATLAMEKTLKEIKGDTESIKPIP